MLPAEQLRNQTLFFIRDEYFGPQIPPEITALDRDTPGRLNGGWWLPAKNGNSGARVQASAERWSKTRYRDECTSGFFELDSVAHCGTSTNSLTGATKQSTTNRTLQSNASWQTPALLIVAKNGCAGRWLKKPVLFEAA